MVELFGGIVIGILIGVGLAVVARRPGPQVSEHRPIPPTRMPRSNQKPRIISRSEEKEAEIEFERELAKELRKADQGAESTIST